MRDHKESDYLAGFADGEGCFSIEVQVRKQRTHVRMELSINQRDDSAAIPESLQGAFGGVLSPVRASPPDNPKVRWQVTAKRNILSLIEYFDAHPLVGKAEQYTVWREAAMLYYRHSVGRAGGNSKNPDWLHDALRAYAARLSELKQYEKPSRSAAIEVDFDDSQEPLFDS